ncbi:MAG: (Fe-S)-binding protein, partial [Gemmatimonadales bacterium]
MAAEVASAKGFRALDPCVHCGFCLPACPTYLATGDESDSPRGRIVLMRALERGEIAADDPALLQHLDACLGCRGCEPVCPAGVGYGQGLEAARERLVQANGLGAGARMILAVFGRRWLWQALLRPARWFRDAGLARRLAGQGRFGFAMGMVASTEVERSERTEKSEKTATTSPTSASSPTSRTTTVALFRGCVMDALFSHVHDATRRTLEANGYRVVEVQGQVCCGALHAHAGDRRGAAALARANVAAFDGADYIVVNSAGCGALLKDYGHLLDSRASAAFAARVRDVSELLAERGPRPGAAMDRDVAYDAPCHLQHAQRVHEAPLAVLRAIPGLRLQLLPGFDRCCGSA